MQYNYPLTDTSIESVKEILLNSDSSGFIASMNPGLAIGLLLLCVAIIFFIFLAFADGVINTFLGVIVSFVLIAVSSVFAFNIYKEHGAGGGPQARMKNQLISATQDSWKQQEEYQKFQSSIQRYLESQNINLEKNCSNMKIEDNALELEDSRELGYNNNYNGDFNVTIEYTDNTKKYLPDETIICNSESRKLAGVVKFTDDNNSQVNYKYNTSVNQDNGYAIFTLEKQ